MKIKPASKAAIRRAKLRKLNSHYWLVPEKPKKQSRLKQLNKHNVRVKSEFVLMAERINDEQHR
jgi:hypothetical protein